MHDIRAIRADPEAFDRDLARRGLGACSEEILRLDGEVRSALSRRQQAETERNSASRAIARAGGATGEIEQLKSKVVAAKRKIESEGAIENAAREQLQELLSSLPNRLLAEVPEGESASDNKLLRRYGEPGEFAFAPLHHYELGAALTTAGGYPGMDFRSAARISGARFVLLRGALARLERALIQFMLDLHIGQHGYEEVAPPVLAGAEALYGSGQLPKFAEDLFACGSAHYAISTAEIPLTNLVREQIIAQNEMPLRVCASTPCFRAEAGAAGRDTRGMIRLHQFMKVELVSITRAEDSAAELERMTNCAEEVLKQLKLPYQLVELCSRDTGFSARRTYDLEVWFPAAREYREISSCSDCGDFQARRMNARYRPEDGAALQFVHSLNGSALAVGRTMAALIENYQRADGSIAIPEPLIPFFGATEITAEAG